MNSSYFPDQSHAWYYILLGILLYLIFRVLHFLRSKYFSNKYSKYFNGTFYFIEISSWFVYLFEGIVFFASKNIILSVIIFIVFLFALIWFCLHIARDFFAGLILKIENKFKPGELIELDGISGRIVRVSVRLLELEDDSARKISIPFHQFFVKRYFHTIKSDFSYKENFILKIKNTTNPIELIKEISFYIKQLPWTNINFEPEVSIENIDESTTYIRIVTTLFSEKDKENFRLMLRNRFQ